MANDIIMDSSGMDGVSDVVLRTAGIPFTATLNLFVCNPTHAVNPAPSGVPGKYIPLAIIGSNPGTSGLQRSIPMTIVGTGWSTKMNLYMAGSLIGQVPSNMNMFIMGQNTSLSKTTSLFVQNNTNGATNSIPLNINGQSWWPGGGITPPAVGAGVSGAMNLFIKRWPSSSIPLFIHAPVSQTLTTPLFIKAVPSITKSIPLTMTAPVGTGAKQTSLFVSGW
jgi:hypothetical protein